MGISRHFDTKKNYASRLDTVQNVPIPPDRNSSIPLNQNVLIFLVRYIHIYIYKVNIETFW